jgi:hypothetical protein
VVKCAHSPLLVGIEKNDVKMEEVIEVKVWDVTVLRGRLFLPVGVRMVFSDDCAVKRLCHGTLENVFERYPLDLVKRDYVVLHMSIRG